MQQIGSRTGSVLVTGNKELTFHDFSQVLRRHRNLVILLAVGLGLLALAGSLYRGDRYTAVGQLQIEAGSGATLKQTLSNGAGLGEFGDIDVILESDSRVLTSDTVLLSVVRKLQLQNNSTFLSGKKVVKTSFFGGQEYPLLHGNIDQPLVRTTILKIFKKGLAVDRVPRTQMLTVSYKSRSAELSASIVNALESEFIERNFSSHYSSTMGVTHWLSGQIEDLRKKVQDSQEKVASLEKKLGVFSLDPQHTLLIGEVASLEKGATDATEQRVLSEARYRILSALPPDQIIDSPTALGSDGATSLLAGLRAQRATAAADLARLTPVYGPRYPAVKQLNAQISSIDASIQVQQQRILQQAKGTFELAKQAEGKASGLLTTKNGEIFGQRDNIIQYEIASQELASNRQMYESILQRLREAAVDAGLSAADIQVVDLAIVPGEPSSYSPAIYTILGLAFGFIGSVTAALIFDRMDTHISDPEAVQQLLGLPWLAFVPRRKGSRGFLPHRTSLEPKPDLLLEPQSPFAESFRALRTAIRVPGMAGRCKVITVTSCRPGEGKTTVSINMAITLAQSGKKVLLVDADLRRPAIQERLHLTPHRGLADVLANEIQLAEAVVPSAFTSGLDIIQAGTIPGLPSELLSSVTMHSLVAEVRNHYDYVIFDTPQMLSVTDAAVVAEHTDGTLLVVRQGYCTPQMLSRVSAILGSVDAGLLGFVFNGVDVSLPAYYGTPKTPTYAIATTV